MFLGINALAVFVVALLSVALWNVWYSPLFFHNEYNRFGSEQSSWTKFAQMILYALIFQYVFFAVIAWVIVVSRVSFWEIGIPMSLLLAAYTAVQGLNMRRPFLFFCMHVVYTLFVSISGIAILMYWPW